MSAPTIAGLMAPVLETAPLAHGLEVTFDDVTVVVATNSHALSEKLGRYFRDFLGGGGTTIIEVTAIEAGPPEKSMPITRLLASPPAEAGRGSEAAESTRTKVKRCVCPPGVTL